MLKKHTYLISGVVNYGYDSHSGIELEKAIRENFHVAIKTTRKNLFAPFIKIWAEETRPGFFVVGCKHLSDQSQAQDVPVILNREDIINNDLRSKRVLEFLQLK